MGYVLLTGATGLLGSYLLRNSLLAGLRMAVFVRGHKTQSARQRIEVLLTDWERRTGCLLPRPVVLEGDLCRPDLGLSPLDVRWIARHCHAVLHNAASLTFNGPDRSGEPWRSNVDGTQHLLDLCARCALAQFHHVSTAYVCGLRRGRILETQLDLGQQMSNDYERSKLEAEKRVLAARLPEPPTIYRPSIIIGDSQTAYTSTFHGFYAMVKFSHTLSSRMVLGSVSARRLFRSFGLTGRERKDYVPVDWVASVMTHILSHPRLHGRTYHLTAATPTPIAVWSRAIQDAIEQESPLTDESDPLKRDEAWFKDMLGPQLEIYRPYWRDDPRFDRTHTMAAAAHLPCPRVDRELLADMARFAIRTRFGKASEPPEERPAPVPAIIDRWVSSYEAHPTTNQYMHVGLQLDGPGGGQWKLLVRNQQVVAAEKGIDERCAAVVQVSSDVLRRLLARELPVTRALNDRRIRITGDPSPSLRLADLLNALVASETPAP